MNISIAVSIFFILSYIFAFASFFMVKKKEETLNMLLWLVLTFVTMMCFHTLSTSLMKIFGLPFTVHIVSLCNFILGAGCSYKIYKDKSVQKYKLDTLDIIATVCILAVVLFFAYHEFSLQLKIGYATSDPGVHYGIAMEALRTGTTTGMFFAEINNALFLGCFLPFMDSLIYGYKLFILTDIFMFFLSGVMFYCIAKEFLTSRSRIVIGSFFILLYIAGYPLNNMVFGFVYLGMSVTLIAYLMILTRYFVEDKLDKKWLLPMLMSGCLSLVLCYMLFAPVIWCVVFFCIAVYYFKKGQLFKRNTILIMLIIFLIPSLLAIKFCYFDYFIARDLHVQNTIANEGGIYKNFFSNFILLMPFAIFGIIENLKKNLFHTYNVYIVAFFVFMCGLFLLLYLGKVSEYYYFKGYYAFWMLFMVLAIQGMDRMLELPKSVLCACLSSFFIFLGIDRLNLENRIIKTHPQFPEAQSSNLFDIYLYNVRAINDREFYNENYIDLFQYTMDNLMPITDKPIPLYVAISSYQDWYWFESFTGMNSSEFYTWDIGDDKLREKLVNNEADYVIVEYADRLYQRYPTFLDQFKIIYENEDGAIYQIQP